MDSDIYFKEERPHLLYVDQNLLNGLLTGLEPNSLSKKRNRRRLSTSDRLITIVNNEIPLGIISSINETTEDIYHDITVPVNLIPSNDPTMLDVLISESEITLESLPTKRKRHSKDKSIPSNTLKLLFQIQILEKAQRIRHEVSLLHCTYPKNMAIFIENPLLKLQIMKSSNQTLHLKGGISYSLRLQDSIDPLGFFAMKSKTVANLLSFITQDEIFSLKASELPLYVDGSMFYGTISQKKELQIPESIKLPLLTSQLLRYQKETVRWMLRKEAKDLNINNDITSIVDHKSSVASDVTSVLDVDRGILNNVISPPGGWRRVECQASTEQLWVNPYSGACCSDKTLQDHLLFSQNSTITGGLLAEEMGLGKTVEIIALMLLNRRPLNEEGTLVYDNFAARTVRKAKTTLIISPASIARQFIDEIGQHAPDMKVYYYKGVKQSGRRLTPEELSEYDVIITHYRVISSEIHYALFNPEARNTRQNSIHPDLEALKSPLMQIEFWRVVLDEAQMVSSGVSAAARVARMIPRVHAWAVTGTPVERNMDDLQGLLTFMRYPVFGESHPAWRRLLASPSDFCDLFSHLAIRHTAHMVKGDIVIPRQSRVSIHLLFSPVEDVNYNELYREFLHAMGLSKNDDGQISNSIGGSVSFDQLDYGKLAYWFQKLRQACSHPRVGLNNRKIFGGNVLKTIKDLLDNMLTQSSDSLFSYQRSYYVTMLERGQVNEYLKMPDEALITWKTGLEGVILIVNNLREEVLMTKSNSKSENDEDDDNDDNEIKDKRARLRSWLEVLHRYYFFIATANYQLSLRQEEREKEEQEKEQERQKKQEQEEAKEEHDEDYESHESHKNKNENKQQGKKELLDSIKKEIDINHIEDDISIKIKAFKEEEMKYYDFAQELRQELLRDAILKVEKSTKKLKKTFKPIKDDVSGLVDDGHDYYQISKRPDLSLLERFMLMTSRLNKQASIMNEWRKELFSLLTGGLVDQNADPDGEEYAESLDDQEKAFSYLEVLQQMVSDRSEAITGTFDPVVNKAEKFQRNKTQNSREARSQAKNLENEEHDVQRKRLKIDSGEQEQKSEFQLSVEEQRRKCYPVHQRSLVEMLASLKDKDDDCGDLTPSDEEAINGFVDDLKTFANNAKKDLGVLNREITGFRNVYNARVAYYKQLQELSDSVTSYFEEGSEIPWNEAMSLVRKQRQKENNLLKLIHNEESRKTYLESLKRPDEQLSADDRQCIICQDEILIGSLTVCGHRFCRACLQEWFARRNACPVCKTVLGPNQVYNFTLKSTKVADVEKDNGLHVLQDDREDEFTRSNPIYREVTRQTMNEILSDNSDAGLSLYGTKIEMILKHLKWLRSNDSTCQVVIFSQWAEMLELLDYVLTVQGIKHASVKSHMDDFKKDPEYACFLLHAKNESAGLTLVNATHVYLCEPLVNTALEVQAISRIHRIGQTRATTVWLFVIRDTVEEAVLKLATDKRLEFLTTGDTDVKRKLGKGATEQLSTEDIAVGNSYELTKSVGSMINKKFSGGEAVEREDLMKVLFKYGKVE